MKDLIKKMQKAVSVHKIVLHIFFICFIISCAIKKSETIKTTTYYFKQYKSKSGFSSINIKAYDYEYRKELDAAVRVNNVYFSSIFNENKVLEVKITPNNKFDVEVFFPSRYTVKIKEFYVKKGDSIVITTYLKEDNRPVY